MKLTIDFYMMVNHQFPGDTDFLSRVSIIDESQRSPCAYGAFGGGG